MARLPSIDDYITSISTPQLIIAEELKGGECVKFNGYDVERYTGGFCVVFPFNCRNGKVAVRCWHAQLDNIQRRTKLISEELESLDLPYFVKFKYVDKGIATSEGIEPIVIMDWVKASPFKDYIEEHLNDKQALRSLNANFLEMVKCLHSHNISHGDLQHGNILVKADGTLVLVDYDSMYVPNIDGFDDEVKGLEGYQHESRWTNQKATPKADYFSELVIYLSINALIEVPELWNQLKMGDSETMLFSGKDIKSKGSAPIFQLLRKYPSLAPLTDKLIDFMNRETLEELEPLEDCLIPKIQKVTESLSIKWNDTSKMTITPRVGSKFPTSDIVKKWQNKKDSSPSEIQAKKEFTGSISNKWNKRHGNR